MPATKVTGPPIIPRSSSRIGFLERVSLRPESPGGRCAISSEEGSTATTSLPAGS